MNKNQIAVNLFNKLAKQYQQMYMNVDMYKKSLDLFCEKLEKRNSSILEIACGPGNVTQYVLNKCTAAKILGIDLAPNMIDLAILNNPGASFKVMDCREILQLNQQYDAIICAFCLPYLSIHECEKLIIDFGQLLMPKGLLYISTIAGDYTQSTFRKGSTGEEIFMHYYSLEILNSFLVENRFELVYSESIETITKGEEVNTDIVLIAQYTK